jgi:hypothetical protein
LYLELARQVGNPNCRKVFAPHCGQSTRNTPALRALRSDVRILVNVEMPKILSCPSPDVYLAEASAF